MKTVLSQYAFAIVVLLIQDTIICQNNNLRPNINPPSPVVMAPPAGNAPPPPAPANQVNAQNPSVPLNNNNGNGLPVANANPNANNPVNNLRTNNNIPQNAIPNSSPNLSGNNGGVSNNNGLGNNHGGANTGILPNNSNNKLNHVNGNGMNSKNATSLNAVPGAKKDLHHPMGKSAKQTQTHSGQIKGKTAVNAHIAKKNDGNSINKIKFSQLLVAIFLPIITRLAISRL